VCSAGGMRGWRGCKHTARHAATVDGSDGKGGAFRAARTTWTPDRTGDGGGGGNGIPSLRRRRRRISLRRTTAVAATDADDALGRRRQPYYTHRHRRREAERDVPPADTLVRTPESIISAAVVGPPRTPTSTMVRPPVTTKLLLGLYSLFYSCTIALDGKKPI